MTINRPYQTFYPNNLYGIGETMISNKNMDLADDLLKLMVQEHIPNIRFGNTSKSLLMKLSDQLHQAMEMAGYNWSDVEKAMKNDVVYLATTTDTTNRKIDRIMRDYRAISKADNHSGRDDHILPDADTLNSEPAPSSNAPNDTRQAPIPEHDRDHDQDQSQDQDQNEPEDEPEPDDDPETDPDSDPEEDQSQQEQQDEQQDQDPDDDPQPNPDPEPDDPNMDLIERIVRYNMDHPDNVINIMLYGPRGTAKTRMGIDVSYRVFGEPPSIMTAPQDKYEIIGYADAHGNPVPTTFIKGYTKPGIMLIDEIDRMDQTAGIAMNSAISNGLLDTTYMGVLERDPKMTIIATANTAGTGADQEYVTANVMDSSIRDRFIFIPIGWDHDKALAISHDPELTDFIERWNRACDRSGLGVASASYRALLTWSSLSELEVPNCDIMNYVLLKGALDPSDLISVWENMQHRSTIYDTTLSRFADAAKAGMLML